MADAVTQELLQLNQRLDGQGQPLVTAVAETRVWQRQGGRWRHVHFHRSSPGPRPI